MARAPRDARARREVETGAIETVSRRCPDLYGRLVGKRITGAFFLDEVAGHGMHVCDYLLACDMEMDPTPGYAFTSWETGYGDLHACPTSPRCAARPGSSAPRSCSATRRDEERDAPIEVAPRSILRRQLERCAGRGLVAKMGSELEFFLFRDDYRAARAQGLSRPRARPGGYVEDYHILSGTFAEDVIRRDPQRRRRVGASPSSSARASGAPASTRSTCATREALEMADRHVVYKQAAKEIAAAQGCSLTFMAKWDDAARRQQPARPHEPVEPERTRRSSPASEPLAGTRRARAPDLPPLPRRPARARARARAGSSRPTVNSYKRYRAGTFAPTGIAWSYDNRTAGFRVVGERPLAARRVPDPGRRREPLPRLRGAARRRASTASSASSSPGPAFAGDVYAAADLPRVPRTLPEAIGELERARFARKAFGDDVVDHLLHFARTEQGYFEAVVTDWEKRRYFERA